ncbi:MAG: phosphate signaling complex protein PhoU [Verrucomicrobia subdivision 3 bacterium]|nr:phosphate signaling complex protein PhoU [Limisphaerales bacterium]
MQRTHILATFDEALNALRQDVLMMASLTERNLTSARKGLFERNDEACNHVIADDEAIDQLEKQVDRDGVALLTRFQPVASDLRQVISAMKISSNLERIADQATSIARKARKLNQQSELPEVSLLQPMFQQAFALFADSMNSYVQADVALASVLKSRDKELDALNADIAAKLTERIAEDSKRVADYLNLMFVSRHLERVGDHATNIAEDAVYAAAAADIRHTSERPPLNS